MSVVFLSAFGLTVFLVLALLIAPALMRPSPAARRILEMVQSSRPDQRKVGTKERLQVKILSLANGVRIRLGLAEDEQLKQQLFSGGIKTSRGANAYLTSRFLGPVIGLALGSLMPTNTVFWSLTLGAVFYLLPDMWLKLRIKKRRERIRRSLPDALDLLVICVEAGLGLDQAMLRVGQELILSHPDIHQEFMQVNLEQLAGKPRLDAWKSAADRTQIGEFSLFVSMLTQADRFGTPIVRALSRFGDEIRLNGGNGLRNWPRSRKSKYCFRWFCLYFPAFLLFCLRPQFSTLPGTCRRLNRAGSP
jgi:tight adherence protein C